MFTGIVQERGLVARVERAKGLARLSLLAPKTASRVGVSESVCVSGACLTVVAVRHGTLTFEAVPETLRLTTLGALRSGAHVNLEPSLTMADRLGGHLVFGHVDGMGTVVKRQSRGGETVLTLRVPREVRRLLVPKGPLAVDGVSLTVGPRLTGSTCTLHLIPETMRLTTLGEARVGQRVNLEADYFAKLAWQFLRPV